MSGLATEFHPVSTFVPVADASVVDASIEFDHLRGQFLASLNHELRTPLSGVLGMTDLLAETSLESDQREYLDTIRECATQLLEALNAILDFSSLSSGRSQVQNTEFALPALLESVAADGATRAAAKGLRLVTEWDAALPETIIGDERYFQQVLHHLVRNAVKFTSRGEVALAASVSAGASGPWLRIIIKDSGIGIPQDKLRVIFQAFRQLDTGLARSYSGMGLGLALSDQLVRLMGGEISVESTVGRGATFTIRVPITVGSTAVHGAKHSEPATRRRPLILVVEDNKIAQRVVEHVLEKTDCDLLFADDGPSGVRIAGSKLVDLILMDLQMPGMDGFAASTAIRQLPGYATVPILALTANYSDEHRATCRKVGMQGFLAKPIQREELLKTIKAYLPSA